MSNATLGGNAISAVQGGTGITVTGGDTVNLDTPVDETNGGTGQTTYATGDILYASASNTLSKLNAGTDGEVLTLASGIPSWAAQAGGGSWNYLASATASGSSQIEFTSIIDSTYQHYVLVIRDVYYSANGQLRAQFSSNNGSSYLSSGYQTGANGSQYSSGTWNASSSSAEIILTNGTNTIAGTNACAEIHFFNMDDSTSWTTIMGSSSYINSDNTPYYSAINGSYKSTTAIDAFRVYPSTGTLTIGEFILYGISES